MQLLGVEMSGVQASNVEILNAFLAPMPVLDLTTGEVTMLACCLVWSVGAVHELAECVHFMLGLWYSIHTEVDIAPSLRGGLVVSSVRGVLVLIVLLARFALGCSLLPAGIWYLARHTIAIPDLLLNMVALEFILVRRRISTLLGSQHC